MDFNLLKLTLKPFLKPCKHRSSPRHQACELHALRALQALTPGHTAHRLPAPRLLKRAPRSLRPDVEAVLLQQP